MHTRVQNNKQTSKETPHVKPADLKTQKVDQNGIFDAFECDATPVQGLNSTTSDIMQQITIKQKRCCIYRGLYNYLLIT